MPETKALSPEIISLFETVRSQARKYATLYEKLEFDHSDIQRQLLELEMIRNTSSSFIDDIKDQINSAVIDMHGKINTEISVLENETDKTSRAYKDLMDVKQVRDALMDMLDNMKKDTQEWRNLFESYKISSITEIDVAVNNIKSTFEEQIIEETQKLEGRQSSKLLILENKLLSYDNKIREIKEKGFKDSPKSSQDNFKNLLIDYQVKIDENIRLIKQQVYEVNADINDKISMLFARLDDISDIISTIHKNSQPDFKSSSQATQSDFYKDMYPDINLDKKQLDKLRDETEERISVIYQQMAALQMIIKKNEKNSKIRSAILTIVILIIFVVLVFLNL